MYQTATFPACWPAGSFLAQHRSVLRGFSLCGDLPKQSTEVVGGCSPACQSSMGTISVSCLFDLNFVFLRQSLMAGFDWQWMLAETHGQSPEMSMAISLQCGCNFHNIYFYPLCEIQPAFILLSFLLILLLCGLLCFVDTTCQVPHLCERGAVPGGLAYRYHHRQREGLWCLRTEQTNEEFCVMMTPLKWNGLENQSDSFSDYCVTQLLQSPWGPRQRPSHRKCRRKASEIELLWTKARSCCCAFQMERLYYE